MFYYKVTAKCGHVGKGRYCIKNFYIKANGKSEARKRVERMPRVKKGLEDAVMNVRRISFETYMNGVVETGRDPYFKFKCEEDVLEAKKNGYKEKTYWLSHNKGKRKNEKNKM